MSYRTVYQLDPDGYIVGEERAYESPLEPGVFLVPAYCVVQAPPDLAEGERARWVDGWEIIPPEPEPLPEADLPRTDAELFEFIGLLRAAREAAGVQMGGGQTFASDLVAAANVEATLAFMAAAGRLTTRWKSWTGWVELTHLQLGELRVLIGAHRERCFAAEELAAADVAAGAVTTYAQADAAFSVRFEEI